MDFFFFEYQELLETKDKSELEEDPDADQRLLITLTLFYHVNFSLKSLPNKLYGRKFCIEIYCEIYS